MLRIGVLGAARIAPAAIVAPARKVPAARLRSVAARDHDRARAFATKHGIPVVHDTYDALVEDPEIDAVYNPLPNGLHAVWTEKALLAGKHVLCEKPLTSNAAEAAHLADVAESTGLVLMEAFHYRYHPLARRMQEVVEADLGVIERVETWMCFPLPRFADIRYNFELGGGALMDAGCYAVHMARMLGAEEPSVTSAAAILHSPDVDRAMTAELAFPSGHTGAIHCSMWSRKVLKIAARVVGSKGEMNVINPAAPQAYHRLSIKTDAGRRVEHLSRRPSYEYQLEAFCAAVAGGAPALTDPADAVANMTVIDAIYQAAGMRLRGT